MEVAHDEVGHAHVGSDHGLERRVDPAALVELHDGNEEPFLVHLARLRGEDVAADIRGVAGGGEEGDEVASPEDGVADGDVVEVARRLPRVVGDDHVPPLPRVHRIHVENVLHGEGHGVDVPRRARHRLRHHPASPVEDTRGQIARLAHDGREGRAHQRGRLLVDDADQPVPADVEGDRIKIHDPGYTISVRRSSTRSIAPGPATVVDSRSSMMAGPWKAAPGWRA